MTDNIKTGSNSFIVKQRKRIKYFIRKRLWIFAAVGLLAGVCGWIYASFQKPVYESNLTFALDDGGAESGLSGALGLAAQFGINIGGSTQSVFNGDNITEIIKSRKIIEQVLLSNDTLDGKVITMADYYNKIMDKKWRNKGGIINVSFNVGLPKEKFSYLQDSILFCMYTEIAEHFLDASRPDKKLNIFQVNVTSPDERFTKIFTDKVLKETTQFYTELRTQKSQQTIDALEARLGTLKNNLYGSLSSKAGIQDANINPAFNSAQVPVQKQQINIQSYGGAYEEIYKNLELARYQFLREVPLLQIINSAEYPMKRVKASRLKFLILFAFLGWIITLGILFIKDNWKEENDMDI